MQRNPAPSSWEISTPATSLLRPRISARQSCAEHLFSSPYLTTEGLNAVHFVWIISIHRACLYLCRQQSEGKRRETPHSLFKGWNVSQPWLLPSDFLASLFKQKSSTGRTRDLKWQPGWPRKTFGGKAKERGPGQHTLSKTSGSLCVSSSKLNPFSQICKTNLGS